MGEGVDPTSEREDKGVVAVEDLTRFFIDLLIEHEDGWCDAFFANRIVSSAGKAVGDMVL